MCSTLSRAGLLDTGSRESSLETDLLLAASEAIIASHALSGKYDVGMHLSTLLLAPHVTPKGDLRVHAALAESLGRHAPGSDSEATLLLDLMKPLVMKKSERLLEACKDMVLSRYRFYLRDQMLAGAIFWLLRGLELERLVFDSYTWDNHLAACTFPRLFVSSCLKASSAVIEDVALEHGSDSLSRNLLIAKEIAGAVENDESKETTKQIQEYEILQNVIDIVDMIIAEPAAPDQEVAKKVVACLEDGKCEEDVVLCKAHPSQHAPFLLLALKLLQDDRARYGPRKATNFQSSFDKHGISVLMERFTIFSTTWGDGAELPKPSSNTDKAIRLLAEQTKTMNAELSWGLQRAFISENAKRKTTVTVGKKKVPYHQFLSCTAEEKEQIVRDMLSF